MEQQKVKMQIFPDKEAWKKHRKTLFTSSRINELMGMCSRKMTAEELEAHKKDNPKSKKTTIEDETILSEGAISYILELIQNELSDPEPDFYDANMEWGNVTEPQAAISLAEYLDMDINSDGFVYTSENGVVFFERPKESGGTPDIILQDLKANGELKCPKGKTHLRYMLFYTAENFQENEPKYYDQMQRNMYLTNSDKCYFVSYDPRFKNKAHQRFVLEIPANRERQQQIQRKVDLAHAYRLELLGRLKKS
jgi:hypothetical protein